MSDMKLQNDGDVDSKNEKGGRIQGRGQSPIVDSAAYSRVVDAGGLPEPMKCGKAGRIESRPLHLAVQETSWSSLDHRESNKQRRPFILFRLQECHAPDYCPGAND